MEGILSVYVPGSRVGIDGVEQEGKKEAILVGMQLVGG